jgi:hypothetical protein
MIKPVYQKIKEPTAPLHAVDSGLEAETHFETALAGV